MTVARFVLKRQHTVHDQRQRREREEIVSGSSRREFCIALGQLASVAGGAALVSACGGSPTSGGSGSPLTLISATVSAGVASVAIGASSPLGAVGGTALVSAGNAAFLVARTGDASFSAVSAFCTHEGCTVSGVSGNTYICPCHGSEFSTSGTVLRGPANAPLPSHATAFSNGVLTIAL